MLKANYHTHLKYCNHAIGNTEDYVKVALENEMTELGISDHAPLLASFLNREDYESFGKYYNHMTLDILYTKYLPEIAEAKQKYSDKIRILSAFEIEYLDSNAYFVRMLRKKVDYLNLGVHLFDFDGHVLNSYHDVNPTTIYGYLEACIKGIKSGVFNVVAHPDLFMFSYQDKNGNRIFDKHCAYVSRKIIEAAIQYDVYLELNANGIQNSMTRGQDKNWLYPCREFWEIAKEYKTLKIIIGADAHKPELLSGKYIAMAEQFAKELELPILDVMEIRH